MKKIIHLIVIACITIVMLRGAEAFAQKQGQEKIDSLFTVLKTAKEDTAKVNTLNALASEFRNNDPDTAIYFAHEALAIAIKINYKMGIADAYLWIGTSITNLGKYEDALKNINDALKLYDQLLTSEKTSDKSNILKQKSRSYNNLGIIYSRQGNYYEALMNHFAAQKIRKETGDKKGSAASYNNIGAVYSVQGNYPEALKNYFAALKTWEEIGDNLNIANSYNTIGVIYYEQSNYSEALKNYFAALKIFEEIGDKEGISLSYNNIGNIYGSQSNYPEALKNQFAALKIREDAGDKHGIAASYNNIGEIYMKQGNYPEALKNQFTALKIFEEIGDKEVITVSYNNIGNNYIKQKKNNEAYQYLNKGLSLAKEIGSLDDIKESFNGLAKLESAQGNFKQAYEHYKMYITYRDSLVNEENTKKMVQSQMQYEFDKKEAGTKAEQDKKDILAKVELIKEQNTKYEILCCLIVALIVAGLFFSRFRIKQKAAKTLEEKNKIIQNTLDELKKSHQQLVQSEKMASLGQLTAGVAHEINNPINFVSANVKPLKRNYEELVDFIINKKELNSEDLNYNIVESKQLFSGIEEGSRRTIEIVKGLRNFSRHDEGEKKKANINEGIESTLMLVHNLLNKKNVEVIKSYGNIPEIECYPGQLNQVFMNVIANAIDAIGENGKITITTLKKDDQIKISICDTGKGMNEEVKQKIFDPFFTTKDVGMGTGLGLSISYGIVEKHNGKIEVVSEVGKGSEFIITLPVS